MALTVACGPGTTVVDVAIVVHSSGTRAIGVIAVVLVCVAIGLAADFVVMVLAVIVAIVVV
eukprot:2092590-Alexandrium_andersonii.AAC.1